MGPNGTQSRCVKSLRDGRGILWFRIFQIEVFLCIDIEFRKVILGMICFYTKRILVKNLMEFEVKFGHFLHFASKMKVVHVLKQEKVVFRERFRAKVENDTFDSF